MWYLALVDKILPVLERLGPILGAKLIEMAIKWADEKHFTISPLEDKISREEHWLTPLPKLYLKKGVLINGAHFYPEIVKIIDVVRQTAPETKDGAVWITSAADVANKRVPGSLHYKNKALDFRINNVKNPNEVKIWAANIAEMLGGDYDVVLEANHIHIELDPPEEP